MASENGWEPAHASPDQCVWVTVPGTNVTLQLLRGWPSAIMRAFAADFAAYVEPLRDADSAGWTPTNAVATSNHLNGTAMDLNWDSHPFQVLNAGFDAAKIGTIRQLLDFYEDTIWWGNDWDTPRDAMHFQMGYNSFNNPHTGDVIARKIRPDGFSTFRRGAMPLSKSDQYALAIIGEGRRRGISPKGIQIAIATALVESGLKNYANSNVPESMGIPHDAVGSDHDSVGLFQQRCPMWGPAEVLMNPSASAGLFYDHLETLDYNSDAHTPGWYAQAVQRSAFPDRYDQRFGDAVALYDRLAGAPPLPPPLPPQPGDDMALVPQDQWDNLYRAVMANRDSRSPLRHLGEHGVGDTPDQIWDIDGSVHVLVVEMLARHGSPADLALLREVASANPNQYPERQRDAQLAQAILADLEQTPPAPSPQPAPAAPPVYQPPPQLPAVITNGHVDEPTTGQLIGNAYDALEKLRLADALPIESRAPLAALIAVLQTKNGSQV